MSTVKQLKQEHRANNVYYATTKSELIKYLHQAACSPVKATWKQAIENGANSQHDLAWQWKQWRNIYHAIHQKQTKGIHVNKGKALDQQWKEQKTYLRKLNRKERIK